MARGVLRLARFCPWCGAESLMRDNYQPLRVEFL